MSGQTNRIHRACGDKVKESLDVSLLSPSNVSRRQILPSLLVGPVVTTGPIGTRNAQVELLLIKEIAPYRNGYITHGDEHASIAGQPSA